MRSFTENLIGKVLDGRYHIERKLDSGGISAVYVASDNRLVDKKVVVKVLLEESYKNEYVVTKFRQEIEALARLRHPNIVDILDSGTLPDGMPYIVLEFIKGASLRTLIRPEGGDLMRAAQIIRQAASALTAAHENGILHRDLKPENIMLRQLDDGEEQVKVIDFGIAKIENSVVAPETAVVATAGTIAYMSPEQLSATKLSPASDIFSLGVVAYELLTGQKPFRPQTPFQLLEMHRAGVTSPPRELRPAVSETAQMVLLKALAFDPNERYVKARDFGDDLFESLTGLPGRTGRLENRTHSLLRGGRPADDATSVYAATPAQHLSQQHAQPFAPDGRTTAPGRTGPEVQTSSFRQPTDAQVAKGGGKKWLVVGAVGLVLLLALGGVAAALVWKFSGGLNAAGGGDPTPRPSVASNSTNTTAVTPETPAASAAETGFSYSLTVQRVRDGKPFGEPFESSGQKVLENGWKVRLNISGRKDGYIYLVNEGPNEVGQTELVLLFPNHLTNGGSARLPADETLTTPTPPSYFNLSGKADTEKIWIIWSANPIPELEAVRDAVYAQNIDPDMQGEISDAAHLEAVRALFARYDPAKVKADENNEVKRTDVRGSGDVVVYLARLEHQ